MKILKSAQAGSLESQDILITVEIGKPNSGIVIELDSPSSVQYGKKIHDEIETVVKKFDVEDVYIKAIDKGALGFTIKARIEIALSRAISEE